MSFQYLYYPNGNVKSEKWCSENSNLRRSTYYFEDGTVEQQTWFANGKLHREDGPANIIYYRNGNLRHEVWYKNDLTHRDGYEPALINYYPDGVVESKKWCTNDITEREIDYYPNGAIKHETYYKNRRFHRDNGPSRVSYFQNGNMKFQDWNKNGKLHNTDGPASVTYYEDTNTVKNEFYFINGVNIDVNKFLKVTACLRKKIWKYRIAKRKELLETLKLTDAYRNGTDICKLICTFVY